MATKSRTGKTDTPPKRRTAAVKPKPQTSAARDKPERATRNKQRQDPAHQTGPRGKRQNKPQQKQVEWRRWLPLAISGATLIGLGIAAAKYLSGPKIWEALHKFDYHYAAPVLALSALYLWFKAVRFQVLLRPFAEVPLGELTRAYFAGQPATFVPGGVATRAALFDQIGVPAAATAVPIMLSSLFDQLMFVITTLVAALWLKSARLPALALLILIGVGGITLLIPAARGWLGQRLGGLAKRFHAEEHWKTFGQAFNKATNWETMLGTFLLSIFSFLTPVLMLALIIMALGEKVQPTLVLLAYTIPNMAARLIPIPGGLGVTEGGMVGMLGAVADVNPNTAAAAAALHRIGDSFFQALLGALVYFSWWKGKDEAQAKYVHLPGKGRARRSRA